MTRFIAILFLVMVPSLPSIVWAQGYDSATMKVTARVLPAPEPVTVTFPDTTFRDDVDLTTSFGRLLLPSIDYAILSLKITGPLALRSDTGQMIHGNLISHTMVELGGSATYDILPERISDHSTGRTDSRGELMATIEYN
ncbi:MAG: hypothetical protein U5K31_03980 [Balneolaceae bacterium]|nr:hypothetical protein [Balneolaceae bacterium]